MYFVEKLTLKMSKHWKLNIMKEKSSLFLNVTLLFLSIAVYLNIFFVFLITCYWVLLSLFVSFRVFFPRTRQWNFLHRCNMYLEHFVKDQFVSSIENYNRDKKVWTLSLFQSVISYFWLIKNDTFILFRPNQPKI